MTILGNQLDSFDQKVSVTIETANRNDRKIQAVNMTLFELGSNIGPTLRQAEFRIICRIAEVRIWFLKYPFKALENEM